jgi:chorismate mutase
MLKPTTDDTSPGKSLAELREEIDRIDTSLHRLLIERGEIIDRLIQVKAQQGGGSAFRPSREADMMRRLVERHHGLLPVDTVETIWRIIISTFTFVQANYAVHVDCSCGDAIMRDCCRFHFGFTVPLHTHDSAAQVIDAIQSCKGDLGLLPIKAEPPMGAWWMQLAGADTPKVIARLPFIERPDHPAGLPLFVIATPLAEATARDVIIFGAILERLPDELEARLTDHHIDVLDMQAEAGSVAMMLAAPGASFANVGALAKVLGEFDQHAHIVELGSHAARFDLAHGSNAKATQHDVKMLLQNHAS